MRVCVIFMCIYLFVWWRGEEGFIRMILLGCLCTLSQEKGMALTYLRVTLSERTELFARRPRKIGIDVNARICGACGCPFCVRDTNGTCVSGLLGEHRVHVYLRCRLIWEQPPRGAAWCLRPFPFAISHVPRVCLPHLRAIMRVAVRVRSPIVTARMPFSHVLWCVSLVYSPITTVGTRTESCQMCVVGSFERFQHCASGLVICYCIVS
jgi:hypothetical protein